MLDITEGIVKTAADGENNPLDLRVSNNAWHGKITPVPGQQFERYIYMWQGYRAGMLTFLAHYKDGQHTLNDIFAGTLNPATGKYENGYAPAEDGNDPAAYAKTVGDFAAIDPAADLSSFIQDGNKIMLIIAAMAREEQGDEFVVNSADLQMAWNNI